MAGIQDEIWGGGGGAKLQDCRGAILPGGGQYSDIVKR